jgi:MFS family permease
MGARHKRKNLLSLLYLLRSLVFLGFVLAPLSAASVLIFAGALGFLWLGTVPLTTSLVSYIFGPVHLTMLNGVVFFGHQVGSFFGGWGGGRLFDLQGNYDMMWWISIALGLVAAALRSGSYGPPPPRCRSRHEPELALLFAVGRRLPGGRSDRRVVRPVGTERPGLSRGSDRVLLPLSFFGLSHAPLPR